MNDIEKYVDDLFNEIESSKLYKDYNSVKKQLKNNTDIMNLINEIKRLQKISVNNEDKSVEKKLKELNKSLESYPIYQSYLIIKEELEQNIFEIKEIFEKYFYDILNIR